MKFEYIGKNAVDEDGNEVGANCYGHELMNGETVELDGWLAEKAKKNPDMRRIKPGPKPKLEIPSPPQEA